jgi:phospholipid/cholesterol/gamma-HCH transport system substrate-binding protein
VGVRLLVKINTDTMARLLFVAVLLISTVAGVIWYSQSVSKYATYQIHTEDPISGLTIDAPIEFHGVEVGKVKSIRLLSPRSVSIALSIEKSAPVTSASVATITSRGLATRGYTGYVYISLDDVGIDSRPLTTPPGEPYPVIPTAPSKIITLDTSINQVKDSSHDTVSALQTQILPQARKALIDLDNLSTTFTGVANKINRDPSILIRGTTPPPPGPGESK